MSYSKSHLHFVWSCYYKGRLFEVKTYIKQHNVSSELILKCLQFATEANNTNVIDYLQNVLLKRKLLALDNPEMTL